MSASALLWILYSFFLLSSVYCIHILLNSICSYSIWFPWKFWNSLKQHRTNTERITFFKKKDLITLEEKVNMVKNMENVENWSTLLSHSVRPHSGIPSPLEPDPIRVQSCVWCLFWTNRNSMAVTSIFLSISVSN